jgi:chromosome segregation protein
MEGMLQGVILVDDLHAAYMVQAQGREGLSVVTRAGELLSAGGTLTGGVSEDVGAHLLSLKRELRTLTSVVADTEKRLQEAQAKHRTLRTAIVERKAAIEGARTEAHGAEIAIVTAEKDARRLEAERAQALRRIASIDAEIATLAMRLNEAGQEERTAEEEIRDAQARRAEATEALESAERVHRERLGAVEEQGARVTEVRVRAAQAHERAEGDRGAIKRLDQSMQEFSEREERLTADVASGVDQQSTIEEELQSSNQQLQETVGEALVARDALGVVREAYESARGELAEHEVQLRDLRSAIDAKSARLNELTLQQRELELDVLRLTEQVQERHDVDVKTTLIDYHNRPLPDASVQARADELRRLIARMGQINLLAIEEYEEKSTRFEYLSSQKVDLEQALAQLDRAIRKMNRESRKLFREAFEAVNLRFKKVFPQLFAGGKAELKLTNPDDLLDTGLDIVAQPPGKRLGSLELMSGGEKALTAVALILAIFQYKPSPFCLLDEVDAPLDEANVGRYANAIRQMTDRSQFIVITHSKRTMEFADMLYGVTMAEPGISNLVSVALKETSKKLESSTTDSQTAAVA